MPGTLPRLHPALTLGPVELTVSDLPRSLAFYREVLGLTVLGASGQEARLGVEGRTLLTLRAQPGAAPTSRTSAGLYHFALLLPGRADLGRFVRHAAGRGVRLGQSDHLVSEAFYLNDPDGHGIEVYRDRPRGEWAWEGGEVRMGGEPIDLVGLLEEAGPPAPWAGVPGSTTMGHVHLRVGDVEAARRFYVDTLGFDVVARWPGALFVSVGGYHHHLGLNAWQSQGGGPAPAGSAHLERVWFHLPSEEAVAEVAVNLRRAGHGFSLEGGVLDVRDPFGTLLSFTV